MKIGLTEARIQVSLLGNPSNEGLENLFSPPHFNTIHLKIILDCTLQPQKDRGGEGRVVLLLSVSLLSWSLIACNGP